MKVPLFTFATFVTAAPTAKLASVAKLKQNLEQGYDVRLDFYKRLREFIPKNHREGGAKGDLDRFVDEATEKKHDTFAARADAYQGWWGSQNVKWVGGKATTWAAGGVDVNVNPELFVSVDGVRHVIKLYFNATERLTTDRCNVVLRLMELGFRDGASPDGRPVPAVLDLTQSQFHSPATSLAYLDPVLSGEAASFSTIWKVI